MKLIINADDFGLNKSVTQGIVETMKKGIVTNTTVMTNSPYFKEAIKLVDEYDLILGIHLVLSNRKPVLDARKLPNITDEEGNFKRNLSNLDSSEVLDEIEKEWRAQINKFLETGLKPSHLDSHHHVHVYLSDEVSQLFIKLAKELDIPYRNINELYKSTDVLIMEYGGTPENSSFEILKSLLDPYVDSNLTVQLMTHPGYCDAELMELSSWNKGREVELEVLSSNAFKDYIKENRIELISFSEI